MEYIHRTMKVAYLGASGSYSCLAAMNISSELVSCKTGKDAIRLVEQDQADLAVLPIENSTEGGVNQIADLLFETNLFIMGEIKQQINHCLISTGRLDEIKAVYSHPQALAQCSEYLKHKHLVETADTASAVEIVKELDSPANAAIASEIAAKYNNIKVVDKSITNARVNYTRFVMLGENRSVGTKNTVCFIINHEPGSLAKVLNVLKSVNMTRIESRPKQDGKFEYKFMVDFYAISDLDKILYRLNKVTNNLRHLGSYESRTF